MLVYVAGPYRGKSRFRIIRFFQVLRNIWRARRVAQELWRHGFTAVCPHLNTFLMDRLGPPEMFIERDLEILAKCDALATVSGWSGSAGTKTEIELAGRHGIPVFHGVGVYTDWDESLRQLIADREVRSCLRSRASDLTPRL